MGMSNAERQRRYVARLKARTEAPHGPQTNPEGAGPIKQLIAEAERLSAPVSARPKRASRRSTGRSKCSCRKPKGFRGVTTPATRRRRERPLSHWPCL